MRDAIHDIVARIEAQRRPVIVGVDGRSGVGKSTFASELAEAANAILIEGDSFYAGGTSMRRESPAGRADICIDRPKLAAVLAQLKSGRPAVHRPFDWDVFDGSLSAEAVTLGVHDVYVLDGVYSCHPDLNGFVDIKVLLRASDQTRRSRLLSREGEIGAWERQWHEAEDWYYATLMTDDRFDIVVDTDGWRKA